MLFIPKYQAVLHSKSYTLSHLSPPASFEVTYVDVLTGRGGNVNSSLFPISLFSFQIFDLRTVTLAGMYLATVSICVRQYAHTASTPTIVAVPEGCPATI